MERKAPEINAGSMADIAFLLLIFFLVATTMNVDEGIQRALAPLSADQKPSRVEVRQRNILQIGIGESGQITIRGRETPISELKQKVKTFIQNPAADENLSEKETVEIADLGKYPVSKGVISIQSAPAASYDRYISVQNELSKAFNEIRDEVAAAKYAGRKYTDLNDKERRVIQKAVPIKISETDPAETPQAR